MQAKKVTSKMIIPVITAIIAVAFIYLGLTKYGFWHNVRGPLPGFFPTIIGFSLLAVSLLAFVSGIKEQAEKWPIENWYPAIGVIAIMVSTLVIGMLPSLAIFVIVWLRWFEKFSWKLTLIGLAVVMAIVIGAFVLWLGVPFPNGFIYDWFQYR
ncbi:MAG: tripartite tricarboxylate transporter TctB family protein [Proteobacteria bacterium]|nr:tripartite tricarboxylate transporter TctB family protein [Pseudomonadota bacterium]NMA23418.1 tripartite tricarboxylate transporter TctB family protein [Spirochaetales bacterium]